MMKRSEYQAGLREAATRALGRRGDDQTEENGICILKEAARQAGERNTH